MTDTFKRGVRYGRVKPGLKHLSGAIFLTLDGPLAVRKVSLSAFQVL